MGPPDNKKYNAFLIHSHDDAEWVQQLAQRLEDECGFHVWLDRWRLVPGESWQQEMALGLDQAETCVVCVGETTPAGWFQQEIERGLNIQCKDNSFRVIPLLLPKASPQNVSPFLGLRTWIDYRHGKDEQYAFHLLKCGVKGVPPGRWPPNNLPHYRIQLPIRTLPRWEPLIGRDSDINELLSYINNSHYLILLEGFGGIGKTVLSIEVAYRCLEEYLFDAVIFVPQPDITLTKIIDQISITLRSAFEDQNLTIAEPDQQEKKVYEVLTKNKCLLIIDGFETINKQEQIYILNFLHYLRNQNQSKVIITARETEKISSELKRLDFVARQNITLLSEDLSVKLIEQKAKHEQILITRDQSQRIYERSLGVPKALIQTIGQLRERIACTKEDVKEALNTILTPTNTEAREITEYCIGNSIEELRKIAPAHNLLLSIAIFSAPADLAAIKHVAGLSKDSNVDNEINRLRRLYLIEVTQQKRYWMLPITREYIYNKEFLDYPDFREAAQDRWVRWYKNYAKKWGGKDWVKWWNKYDYLEQEWVVFLSVLNWCKEREYYEDIRDIWKYLKDYASIYGYWADRLRWMDWLIEKSMERGEWFTALHCMSSKGWTLVQMWELKKAKKLLLNAWKLGQLEDLNIQDSLAKHIVYLYIRQGLYNEAGAWLDRWENNIVKSLCIRCKERRHIAPQQFNQNKEFIKNVVQEDDKRIARSKINILYYRGEICFLEKKYKEAREYFQEVVEKACQCKWGKWTRRINYAQNWLSDISLKEAQKALSDNDFDLADKLLKNAENTLSLGLDQAEINYDKRRGAYYKCSQAKLEEVWGKLENTKLNKQGAQIHLAKALEWATLAIEDFDRLGIKAKERDIVGIEKELAEIRASLANLAD